MSAWGLALSTAGVAAWTGLWYAAAKWIELNTIWSSVWSWIASVWTAVWDFVSWTANVISGILPSVWSWGTTLWLKTSALALWAWATVWWVFGAWHYGKYKDWLRSLWLWIWLAGAISQTLPLLALWTILYAGKSFSDNFPKFEEKA